MIMPLTSGQRLFLIKSVLTPGQAPATTENSSETDSSICRGKAAGIRQIIVRLRLGSHVRIRMRPRDPRLSK